MQLCKGSAAILKPWRHGASASTNQGLVARQCRVDAVSTTPTKIKLWYFGPTTRLLLKLGKVPYEDHRFGREEWPALKPKMPFGQVPVLEVDGELVPQSSAIARYAARLAGLYPVKPLEAARVDAMVDYAQELTETLTYTFYIKDQAEKVAAHKAVVEGALGTRLAKLNDVLERAGPSGWLVGDSMSLADVAMFVALCNLVSGFFEGVPRTLYGPYPHVDAFRKRMANLPEITAFYSMPENQEPGRESFRP